MSRRSPSRTSISSWAVRSRLDLESLQAKLVRGCRGGYCFEQNTLFAAALERIGFRVTTLAARVRHGATRLLPRTHMLLQVDLDEGPYLADVGFGGGGPLRPVPMEPGRESRQFHCVYRVAEEGDWLVLQSSGWWDWTDLYAFTGNRISRSITRWATITLRPTRHRHSSAAPSWSGRPPRPVTCSAVAS